MAAYRKFDNTDLDPCVDLFLQVFSRPPWSDRWPSREKAKAYLSDLAGAPGFRGYLAVDRDGLCGMCFGHVRQWWQGDEYFIDEMCVRVSDQGLGTGTGMMGFITGELKKEGIVSVLALTEKCIPAEGFYRKNGFTASERMVLMYRRL